VLLNLAFSVTVPNFCHSGLVTTAPLSPPYQGGDGGGEGFPIRFACPDTINLSPDRIGACKNDNGKQKIKPSPK